MLMLSLIVIYNQNFIMFSFTLLIIYLLDGLNLDFASSPPSKNSPFDSLNKNTDGMIFSAPLIHQSSPESPFYDPNYSREDHIREGVLNSLARARYFSQMKAKSIYHAAAPVSGTGWNMLMKYTIGTPSVDAYGVFDTGSSFTWIQCLPCINCHDQGNFPIFDPKHSSSYQQVLCNNNPDCRIVPTWYCGSSVSSNPDICLYRTAYMGEAVTKGIVSTETITLSAENTSRTVEKFTFGCSNDNKGMPKVPGVVGVGNRPDSLIHQLTVSHFSYYVFANGTDIHGVVHFGRGASMSDFGMTTPILSHEEHYYLDFQGINVDESNLDFPPGIFEKGVDDDGLSTGFIIDSGCTYTLLRSEAFDVLKTAIEEAMYEYIPQSINDFELCYSDISEAPEVVFHFRDLDYNLCDANLWVRQAGLYCLAVLRLKETDGKLSILGFHQQRNVQVGYDLEKNLLSFVYSGSCPDDPTDFLQ